MKRSFEPYSTQKPSELISMPSAKMIKTLQDCLQMEVTCPGKPYGPGDIRGSFFGLYKRGFLDININYRNRLKPGNWYVTTNGLQFLTAVLKKSADPAESILLNTIYNLPEKIMNSRNSLFSLRLTSDHRAIKT